VVQFPTGTTNFSLLQTDSGAKTAPHLIHLRGYFPGGWKRGRKTAGAWSWWLSPNHLVSSLRIGEAVSPFHLTLWRPRHGHVFAVTIQCTGNQSIVSAITKKAFWATALNDPSHLERHRPIVGLSFMPQQNCCFCHDSAIHSVWYAFAFCKRQGQTWLLSQLFTATTTLLLCASCDNRMSHFSRTAELLGQVVDFLGRIQDELSVTEPTPAVSKWRFALKINT